MKKLIISSLCIAFVGLSAYGQGYMAFASSKSEVYLSGTVGGGAASTLDVSFLWGLNNDASAIAGLTGMAAVGTGMTNGTPEAWSLGTGSQVGTAWYDILNDPNYALAQNASAGNANPVGIVAANGGFSFGNVPVNGSTPDTTYYAFEISWLAADGATPALAAAAGSPLGWSAVFSYSLRAASETAGPNPVEPQFGTFLPAPIPEPATIGLGALGGLALLIFRRRK